MQKSRLVRDTVSASLLRPDQRASCTQVKAAGVAGLVSYALWEFAFWTISVPLGMLPTSYLPPIAISLPSRSAICEESLCACWVRVSTCVGTWALFSLPRLVPN